MIEEYQVYCAFRRAQANSTNKPYRLPKDWNVQKSKMSEQNLQSLERLTAYFNTTYSSVDIERYMACGFELYKGFTYAMFLKKEILQHYINKDKSKKRQIESSTDDIKNSFDFIKSYMQNKIVHVGYTKLQSFCKFRTGEQRDIVLFYNKGNIDQMTLVYCINKKYIVLTDDERAILPYIVQRYRELSDSLYDVKDLIVQEENNL